MVALHDIALGYGRETVLSQVSVEVHAGELLLLVGPNGAGKSTLLHAVSGLVGPSGGDILLGGRRLRSLAARERVALVGLALSEPDGELSFTPRDAVKTSLMGRLAAQDAADRVEAVLRQFHLLDMARKPMRHLSAGQQQRCKLARLAVQDTPIVAMDEPTIHLDPAAQRAFWDWVGQLKERGKAVLVATHDWRQGLVQATKVAVCAGGTVKVLPTEQATPDQLRQLLEGQAHW